MLAAPLDPLVPAPAASVEVIAAHEGAIAIERCPPAHVYSGHRAQQLVWPVAQGTPTQISPEGHPASVVQLVWTQVGRLMQWRC